LLAPFVHVLVVEEELVGVEEVFVIIVSRVYEYTPEIFEGITTVAAAAVIVSNEITIKIICA
jgi:hypothetical protein